jgi:hypothetical protein
MAFLFFDHPDWQIVPARIDRDASGLALALFFPFTHYNHFSVLRGIFTSSVAFLPHFL